MRKSVRWLNTLLAGASIGFALVGAARPSALSRETSTSAGERYFAQMYAVRSIPIGVAMVNSLWGGDPASRQTTLRIAAASQLGDALIGASRREPGQVVAPLLAAGVHLLSSRRER